MLDWDYLGSSHTGPKTVLKLHGTEIARLWQRVDDESWHATLNQHLPWERRYHRVCTSFASGQAGCLRWARWHLAEFEADLEQRRIDSANRQHWLGNHSGSERAASPDGSRREP